MPTPVVYCVTRMAGQAPLPRNLLINLILLVLILVVVLYLVARSITRPPSEPRRRGACRPPERGAAEGTRGPRAAGRGTRLQHHADCLRRYLDSRTRALAPCRTT
jgi:hypothetical protein